MKDRTYLAIDLKSFYASVECVQRGLDPLRTHLVVADESRTEKTICLAVSPSLKAYGIPGRARLFEVNQRVAAVNAQRRSQIPGRSLSGSSHQAPELEANPTLALDFIIARPQMAKYMQVSTQIYSIYLSFVAPEDIHVYSIDEVFIDATSYLKLYDLTPRQFAMRLIQAVLQATGITATAGIGTNLYLAKIAMDIVAKHIPPDADGVRVAELDELHYRQTLWAHRPLTNFWRVGKGIAKKLEAIGLFTMGDIARCSLAGEERLYQMFGVNAELLIDHAWGWEPCTIADIRAYRPESSSLSRGQVLKEPYDFDGGRLIVREMADLMALDLVEKGLVTDQIVLTICYDRECLTDPVRSASYTGLIERDRYGREVPKSAHGSENLGGFFSSAKCITRAATALYERITDPRLLVRRVYFVANHVITAHEAGEAEPWEQVDFFTDPSETAQKAAALEREHRQQETIIKIREKYGKNAILKGMNLREGATTVERNGQVGGHKA